LLTIDRNAKLSGRHALEVWLGAIDSLNPIFNLSTKEWTTSEKDELIRKVKEEILDTKLHLYAEMYFPSRKGNVESRHCVIARKPEFNGI
jgi:hypothetical protein